MSRRVVVLRLAVGPVFGPLLILLDRSGRLGRLFVTGAARVAVGHPDSSCSQPSGDYSN